MTEKQVFQILLKEESTAKSFTYPKLQKEAAVIIAKNLSTIIYDSLKLKSSASNTKRRNVLRFLNSICEVKEQHFHTDDWVDKCLLKIRESLDNIEVSKLLNECNDELENYISNNVFDMVVKYDELRKVTQRKKMKLIEFIKERDQFKTDSKYDIHIVKKFSYYEANENAMKSLIAHKRGKTHVKKITFSQMSDYREQQIKLAYALLNMNTKEDDILEAILNRLASYTLLEHYEQTFIQNLFAMGGSLGIRVSSFMGHFFFLLERIILEYATDLLSEENELVICQYFVNLEGDDRFLRIREISRKDNTINLKLNSLIYELYCMSYCNENILKLSDLIL